MAKKPEKELKQQQVDEPIVVEKANPVELPPDVGMSPQSDVPQEQMVDVPQQVEEPMPVERQENQQHQNVSKSLHRALQPGRKSSINNGLVGELENLLMQAEREGNYARSGIIANLLSKMGGFVVFVNGLENLGQHDLKVLCTRVNELFL